MQQPPWSIQDALELYQIAGWGGGYFGISPRGCMTLRPRGVDGPEIELSALLKAAPQLSPPFLVRFLDILQHRTHTLHQQFEKAMQSSGWQGGWKILYPLKVNQQHSVVKTLLQAGAQWQMGLEAGSRPELLAAIAMLLQQASGKLLVCNGYKDTGMLRLLLEAQRLGLECFMVADHLDELTATLKLAKAEDLVVRLGIRVRLATSGGGRWEDSSGDASKFGLGVVELMEAVGVLQQADALGWLRMLHIHLGSQLPRLDSLRQALQEAGRLYVELRRLGCPVDCLNVGGGLGVNYNPAGGETSFGIGYTELQYAQCVTETLAEICRQAHQPHPLLLNEPGRALTAHHAMLVMPVLRATSRSAHTPLPSPAKGSPSTPTAAALRERLHSTLSATHPDNLHSQWRTALQIRAEAQQHFSLGMLSLSERAQLEQGYWQLAHHIQSLAVQTTTAFQGTPLKDLQALLNHHYFCGFSVFQSLPDAWGLGQEFPLAPLQRLHQRPSCTAVLQDITCDSDGLLRQYVGPQGLQPCLPLHSLKPHEPYWLGVFLLGAYQETLGEQHNLLGPTQVLQVQLDKNNRWQQQVTSSNTDASSMLQGVDYSPQQLLQVLTTAATKSLQQGHLTPAQAARLRSYYTQNLKASPYPQVPLSKAPLSKAPLPNYATRCQ